MYLCPTQPLIDGIKNVNGSAFDRMKFSAIFQTKSSSDPTILESDGERRLRSRKTTAKITC